MLDGLADDRHAGRAQQLAQLGEIVAVLERGDAERALLRAPLARLVARATLADPAVSRFLPRVFSLEPGPGASRPVRTRGP
jgi:hypothetical protein